MALGVVTTTGEGVPSRNACHTPKSLFPGPPSRCSSHVLSFSLLRTLCDSISLLKTFPRPQYPSERM